MLTVHHLNNSRSQRILWLLEELEIPYEIVRYARDKKTSLAPPELKAIHPLGKSPVITDQDLTIAESGAITEYLISKYGKGKLKPSNEADLLKYHYWLHYAEGSAMMPLLLTLIFNKIESSPAPFFIKPIVKKISQTVKKSFIDPQLKLHLTYIESELEKNLWFAGKELSGADFMMSYPVEAALTRGGKSWPRMNDFLNKIKARPAYKRAIERGGEFSVIP